jgi:opacity protein-like surface antigen
LLLLLAAPAQAADTFNRPHWSLELKGGVFFPDTARWSDYYGASYFGEYEAALSYKVLRQLEVGVSGGYGRAKGKGQLPRHSAAASGQVQAGEVTLQHAPLEVFVLGRMVLDENQWLVPYAGGGYTRMFFREEVKGQGTTDGSVDGFHARAGVQFLLDRIDPEAAENVSRDFGLRHTYFLVEGKYTRAMADTVAAGSVNIGGSSCLGGFLFEF